MEVPRHRTAEIQLRSSLGCTVPPRGLAALLLGSPGHGMCCGAGQAAPPPASSCGCCFPAQDRAHAADSIALAEITVPRYSPARGLIMCRDSGFNYVPSCRALDGDLMKKWCLSGRERFSSSLTKCSLLSVLMLLLPVPVPAAAGILTNLLTEGVAVLLSSRVFSGNGRHEANS